MALQAAPPPGNPETPPPNKGQSWGSQVKIMLTKKDPQWEVPCAFVINLIELVNQGWFKGGIPCAPTLAAKQEAK